jgi:hypothetical protein
MKNMECRSLHCARPQEVFKKSADLLNKCVAINARDIYVSVASAVGEGAIAVHLVHRALAEP